MRRPDALFSISLALGAMSLASEAATREEGPTEIEKCQTISKPGSYVLVNNLTANGDCLVITSPRGRVTIDLAGFSISGIGPITGGGSGISADGVEQGALAVRNGTISDFGTGVNFGGTRAVSSRAYGFPIASRG